MRAASHCVISHNHFENLPRYGIASDTFLPSQASLHNVIEHNVLIETNRETSDSGAVEFSGGIRPLDWSHNAFEKKIGFALNNTVRFNNVTRTLGASATDGGVALSSASVLLPHHDRVSSVCSCNGVLSASVYVASSPTPAFFFFGFLASAARFRAELSIL